jgi:rhodanese-related sulfurtransferase
MLPQRLLSQSDLQPAGYREVSPLVVLPHLGELRLVDVREPDEYVGPLGHVAGAALVPLTTVPQVAASWSPDEPVLLICRSGARSGRAAAFLASQGFRNLFNLTGGMLAWEANDLPRVREHDTPLTGLVGEVRAYYAAVADGDGSRGAAAFEAVVGAGACTPDDLRRAVAALAPPDGVSPADHAAWRARIEARLAKVG